MKKNNISSSLFEKSKIGNISLKNRFVRSSTWENMTTEKGHLTQKIYDIYETLAKNEVGLIITGYANIVEEEQPNPGMMGIYEDSFIEEYQKLTKLVHNYDSKIIMQLAYGGTKTTFNVGERTIFAPSNVPERGTKTVGTPMTKENINYIIDAFAKASKRAKDGGFDGVEIHGAHTYLINQFLSPYYNDRTDEYGGNLENRMRFLVEIIEKTKEVVGKDFPVFVKLTASDFFDGGLTFEDTKLICKKIESIGVDAIELSGNIHSKASSMVGESFDQHKLQKEGYFVEFAKEIADLVNIPVITVGGFSNIDSIKKTFEETNIDYFAFSRPLLAQPNLIKLWKDGDKSDAKCIRCSKCRNKDGNYCIIFK